MEFDKERSSLEKVCKPKPCYSILMPLTFFKWETQATPPLTPDLRCDAAATSQKKLSIWEVSETAPRRVEY